MWKSIEETSLKECIYLYSLDVCTQSTRFLAILLLNNGSGHRFWVRQTQVWILTLHFGYEQNILSLVFLQWEEVTEGKWDTNINLKGLL
jgi:hypothetical protein